jgi:RecB family exonuclease
LLFFKTLTTRARASVVLSWPVRNAAGKTVQSSRYLLDLALPCEEAVPCRPESPLPAPTGVSHGRIESADLLAALPFQHQKLSPTGLEDLAKCRFRFFAAKTLGLEPAPTRASERLTPRVEGTILHRALELWLKQNRIGPFVPLFEQAFEEAVREFHIPPGFELEVRHMLLRRIAEGVSANELWTPLASQAEVDVSVAFPGGVAVTGRIDRVDHLGNNECIVIDYKSSRIANVRNLVESAASLQGPLYALALREQFGLQTVAMMYHAVREDQRFGWAARPLPGLDLKEMPPRWIDDARDKTIERLSGFLAGAVHPEPADPAFCRWCDSKTACRYEQRESLVTLGTAAHA